MALNYETVSKQTLDNRSSKTVDAAVTGKNKTMYSYTIQMTISAAGKFVGSLFLACKNLKDNLALSLSRNRQKYPHQTCLSDALH